MTRNMCKNTTTCLNGLVRTTNIKELSPQKLKSNLHCGQTRNGLKNYGNTCYLNAFLQLYFRFKRLRRAVYELSPHDDETGITHQLQLIFSQLQLSESGVVDPGGLIETLRLCDTEQQDAPEFHCLFMNLLEARFLRVGLSVVDDLFRGEYIYETKCLTCGFISRLPSKFLELSVKVSSKSLLECIRNYLQEESLTGDNQYACPNCGQKRDGIRKAYITRAPSLLCIQLLRFTYDFRTGQRKKHKAAIHLPDKLELCSLQSTKQTKSDCVVKCLGHDSVSDRYAYRLCGILLHIGTQPISGHYIAVLRDSYNNLSTNEPQIMNRSNITVNDMGDHSDDSNNSNNVYMTPLDCGTVTKQLATNECWTVCNDMDVFTIPSNQFHLNKINGSVKSLQSYLATCGSGKQKTKSVPSNNDNDNDSIDHRTEKRRKALNLDIECSNSTIKSVTKDLWHSSMNAYMIFYESVCDSDLDKDIQVPSELTKIIQEVNLDVQQKHEIEYNRKLKHENMLNKLLAELVPRGCSCGPYAPLESLNRLCLVPTLWLIDCLNQPSSNFLDSDTPTKLKIRSTIRHSINAMRSCPHDCAPINMPTSAFRIVSTSGLRKLCNMFKDLDDIDLERYKPCAICVKLVFAFSFLEPLMKDLSKEIDYFLRTGSVLPNHKQTNEDKIVVDEKNDFDNVELNSDNQLFYWVGKRSLCHWRTLARLHTRALYCALADKDSNTNNMINIVPIPTTFNQEITCPHNRLCSTKENAHRLPASLWHRLVSLFPGSKIPTFVIITSLDSPKEVTNNLDNISTSDEPCYECVYLEHHLNERAINERQLLSDLFQISTSHRSTDYLRQMLSQTMNTHPPESSDLLDKSTVNQTSPNLNVIIHLVPMTFVNQWCKFIRNPKMNNLPRHFDSRLVAPGVLCEHNLFYQSWQTLIDTRVLCPLSEFEWNTLSKAYPQLLSNRNSPNSIDDLKKSTNNDSLSLFYSKQNEAGGGSFVWHLEPSINSNLCTECQSTIPSYRNARLRIRLVSDSIEALNNYYRNNSVQSSQTLVKSDDDDDDDHSQKSPSLSNSYGNFAIPTNLPHHAFTDNCDQVGDDGQSKVLSVDAKLVYIPHVYLQTFVVDESTMKESNIFNNVKPLASDFSNREQNSTNYISNSDELNASILSIESEPTLSQFDESSVLNDSCHSLDDRVRKQPKRSKLNRELHTNVRRTTRQRLSLNDILLKVDSDQTLLDVKVQLLPFFGVLPSDQHIMFEGIELDNNSKTLEELNICSDSVLFLWTDDPNWNSTKLTNWHTGNSFKPICANTNSKSCLKSCKSSTEPESVETGFKGTRLLENLP